MIKAVIDIGSNSTLLLVAKMDGSGNIVELENESSVTALGKKLDTTSRFSDESMELAKNTLTKYRELIDRHGVKQENIFVTATEASRVAKNAKQFYHKIKDDLNLDVMIISGEGEAYYTALGVAKGIKGNSSESMIMDVGGASTEFIKISKKDKFEILDSISLPIGSVRGTDWLRHSEDLFNVKVDENLGKSLDSYSCKELIAVAGTMTSIMAMLKGLTKYASEKINNESCTLVELESLLIQINSLTVEQISKKYEFLGKRAESIKAGLRVIIKAGRFLKVEKFIVSTYGLRYGVFLSEGIDERFIE